MKEERDTERYTEREGREGNKEERQKGSKEGRKNYYSLKTKGCL